jgi:hypothetical protein
VQDIYSLVLYRKNQFLAGRGIKCNSSVRRMGGDIWHESVSAGAE